MADRTKKRNAQPEQSDFKKSASADIENLVLVEWDFEDFTTKDDKGKDVTQSKAVIVFASDGGEGENIAVEAFGKTMDAFEDADFQDGEEIENISVNITSRLVTAHDGRQFYNHRLKMWRFKDGRGRKKSYGNEGGRTRKK